MDFSKFFSNFDSMESLAILFIMLIAFLFGLIVGYLLRGGTVRRLKREVEQKDKELAEARTEIARLQEELNLREADLRKAQFEAEENRTKVTRLADEKTKLYNEVYALNQEVEQLRTASADGDTAQLNETIERLNAEIATLQSRNTQLERELNAMKDATNSGSEGESVDYLAGFQSTQNALRTRLESLEQKLSKVEAENDSLKQKVDNLKGGSGNSGPTDFGNDDSAKKNFEEMEEKVFSLKANKALLMDPILQDAPEHDDLTRINGISPFLQKQLNEVGVYTFEQISSWDPSDVNIITRKIGYLPGRIEHDNWVGQAVRLAQEKANKPESFDIGRGLYPTDHNDLKVVEGIGPKMERLLKNANINTWEALAEADPDHLRDILNAAGERFQIHDPSTWPAQARLALNGSWELLREYQDQLKGGRQIE
jgi:predicted flap endonuclease-1-like 5' DNA nuclease